MITIDGENYTISPPEELNIHTIEGFVKELRDNLAGCKIVSLNLAEVYEIDSAGFQALIALKNETQKRQIELKIVGISPEVDEIISLYDAQSFIENNRQG